MSLERLLPFAACALAFMALPAVAEELTIVSKETRNKEPAVTRTSYFGNGHLRMSNPDGQDFMFDLTTGSITLIDNNKKQYWTLTKQEREALQAQVQDQMKQVDAQMQNLPPAVREKMQKAMGAMGGGMAQQVSVVKGTGGRTIAGYACENWVITIAEVTKQESCLTTEIAFPAQAFDAQASMGSLLVGPQNPIAKSQEALYAKFKELKGFPLATTSTVTILGRVATTTTEVTEIKKGAIPASVWQIPDAYKKVDAPTPKGPPKSSK